MFKKIFNFIKEYPLFGIIATIILAIIIIIVVTKNTGEFDELAKLAANHPEGKNLLERAKTDRERIKNNSRDLEAYLDLGIIKTQLGDLNGAEKVYLDSLKVVPRNILILNNLALLYVQIKDYKKAEQAFLRLLEITPSSYQTYIHLSELYLNNMNDKKKAEEILLKGLEVMPEMPDLLSALAGFYRDQGQKLKAIEYYKRLLVINPNNSAAREELKELQK